MINQMVLSTEIEWIGYEKKTRMLQVEFIEGRVYQYQNVPQTLFEAFLTAASYCEFLENHIKGRFAFRKIK